MLRMAQDTILYLGDNFYIGLFDCPRQVQNFNNSGLTEGHLLVFPYCPVQITHVDKRTVLADQNSIMFYNQGQEYSRKGLSNYGDYSLFIAFDTQLIIESLAEICPAAVGSANRPIRFINSSCPPTARMAQFELASYLQSAVNVDPLLVETQIMELLCICLKEACLHWYPKGVKQKSPNFRHHNLVEETKKILHLNSDQRVTLKQLANQLATTPFHLCRVFHKVSGVSLNKYINRLRLYSSLELIAMNDKDLTRISLDLGFANPSHFAMAFKKHFAITPTQFRDKNISPNRAIF